jgi:hypothetical protein
MGFFKNAFGESMPGTILGAAVAGLNPNGTPSFFHTDASGNLAVSQVNGGGGGGGGAVTIAGNTLAVTSPIPETIIGPLSSITGALPAGTNTLGGVSLIGPLASITGALPAGSNILGSVTIVGSLPAGTNTIGGVSLIGPLASITGALPAGANILGSVTIVGSLPAGTNTVGAIITPTAKTIDGPFLGSYDNALGHIADGTYGAATTPTPVATAQAATRVDIQGKVTNIGNAYGAFIVYYGAQTTSYPVAPQQSVPFNIYDTVGNIAVSFGIAAVNGGSTTGVTMYTNEVLFRKP